MDRGVAASSTADLPPDLLRSTLVALVLVGARWTGAFEAIVRADSAALHPRRIAIALWMGAVLWIVVAVRQIRTRS